MANPTSTIQLGPLNDEDPHFLSFLSELNTWDHVVTDRSFMEVMKADDDGDDGGNQDGEHEPQARKKAKIDAGATSSTCCNIISSDAPETESRTAVDAELATLPRQLFDAVGDVDIDLMRHILDTNFDENCTFGEATTGGREVLYQYLLKSTDRLPDAVRTIRNCRVVVDEAGNKAVKFKMFTTGTYIKAKSNDVVPDLQGSLFVSNLDEASISKKEIASLKESFATTNATESFSILYHGAICWHLNDLGKVQHYAYHGKVLSLKPVDVE